MISASDLLNAKVLIVDDLEANVLLLERTLSGAGYTSVTSTRNPHEVCDLYRQHRHDLILLDLQMPAMDGFQVMEGLKEIDTDGYLPVLVITAQPAHKLRALQAGAKDFIGKPFDLAEVLTRVHNMLEVRLLHMELKNYGQALEETLRKVETEQKVSERLLLNVLPRAIADRLKGRRDTVTDGFPELIADSFPEVTVLFADIVGFTRFSAGMSPEQLVILLNELFSEFDRIAESRGLEKIKSIGDAYMAAAGVPVPAADHAARAAHMALDLMEALDRFNERRGYNLQLRVGIHSGPVVAGVIGTHKFIYDLWGETVNRASRMESHGLPGRVHMTEDTRQRLGEPFLLEERGILRIKDMGELQTWFLAGRSVPLFK